MSHSRSMVMICLFVDVNVVCPSLVVCVCIKPVVIICVAMSVDIHFCRIASIINREVSDKEIELHVEEKN